MWELSMRRLVRRAPADRVGGHLLPALLGRRPVAMATMATIVTTRMAAANISTIFGMAQSPRRLAAFAKYAPRSGCAVLGVGLTCRKAGAPAAISAAVRCSWACRLLAGLSADCRDHDRRRDHREPVGVLKIER